MSEEMQTSSAEQQGISKFYYTVANNNILLEPGIKTEIIEQQDIFPIPHAPGWCLGMISLRGKLIPVANLQKLLKATSSAKSHWLLVLEKAPFPQLAIRIDHLPMQQSLSDETKNDVDHKKLPHWLHASISIDDKTLYEANHTELFEQLIQQNETLKTDMQELPTTHKQDSAGNNA